MSIKKSLLLSFQSKSITNRIMFELLVKMVGEIQNNVYKLKFWLENYPYL